MQICPQQSNSDSMLLYENFKFGKPCWNMYHEKKNNNYLQIKSKYTTNENYLLSESYFKRFKMELNNIRIDRKITNQELRNRLSDIQA